MGDIVPKLKSKKVMNYSMIHLKKKTRIPRSKVHVYAHKIIFIWITIILNGVKTIRLNLSSLF